jgi:hypothetical protein
VAVVSPKSAQSIRTSAIWGAKAEIVIFHCQLSTEASFDPHVGCCKRVGVGTSIHAGWVFGEVRVVRFATTTKWKAFIAIESLPAFGGGLYKGLW